MFCFCSALQLYSSVWRSSDSSPQTSAQVLLWLSLLLHVTCTSWLHHDFKRRHCGIVLEHSDMILRCLHHWRCTALILLAPVQILDNAIRQYCGNAQLVSRKSIPEGEYLEYEVPGLFGKDFME